MQCKVVNYRIKWYPDVDFGVEWVKRKERYKRFSIAIANEVGKVKAKHIIWNSTPWWPQLYGVVGKSMYIEIQKCIGDDQNYHH